MANKKQQFEFNFMTSGLNEMSKLLEKFNKKLSTTGQNVTTINNALKLIESINQTVDKEVVDGQATVKTLDKLTNLYGQLRTAMRGVEQEQEGKQSSSTYYKHLKEINAELDKTTKALTEQEVALKKLESTRQKQNSTKYKTEIIKKSPLAGAEAERLSDIYKANPKQVTELAKRRSSASRTELGASLGLSVKDLDTIQTILKIAGDEYAEFKKEIDATRESIKTLKAEQASWTNKLELEQKTGFSELELKSAAGRIGPDIDAVRKETNALAETAKAAGQADNAVVSLDKHTKESTSTFGKAAKAIFSYATVYRTLKRIGTEAVNTIREMDKAITGMVVVTGKSREEIQALIPEFAKLANATSSTMTEVAMLTTEYIRQGRTMEEARTLTEQTARAAKIAGISVTESLGYMTSAINGFNLAATEAERVSDIFANLAATTATDYETLAIALSKVSAQANTAGMSIEYTTALLAKGIETTQEAPESIGTALKTILARMRELSDYGTVLEDGAGVNKVEDALGHAGIALRNETGAFREMEDVFNELGPRWEDLNKMQQQAIAQAVAGTRQQSRFLAIMQDWPRTMEMIEDANDSAGTSAYQYSQHAEGMEAVTERLTTAWQGFVQSVTNSETIIDIVDMLGSALSDVNSIIRDLPLAKEGLTITAATLGILKLISVQKQHQLNIAIKQKKLEVEAEAIGKTKLLMENQFTIKQQLSLSLTQLRLWWAKKTGKVEKQNLLTEKQKTLEQQKQNALSKGNMTGGQKAGLAITAAVAVFAIARAWNAAQKEANIANEKLEEIRANSNAIYEISNETGSVSKLMEEYTELSNQITKTTEDIERMHEIENSLEQDHKTSVLDAYDFMAKKNAEMSELRQKNLIATMRAYNAEGSKVFDNQETRNSLVQSFGSQSVITDTTTKSNMDSIAQSIDYAAITKDAADDYVKKNSTLKGVGEGYLASAALGTTGGVVGGVATGGLAGAAAGSVVPVVGTIVGAIAGVAGGIWFGIEQHARAEEENAKMQTKAVEELFRKSAEESQTFSAEMAAAQDKSYAEQIEVYRNARDNISIGYVSEAVKKAYQDMENLENISTEALKQMQSITLDDGTVKQIMSNDQMATLLKTMNGFGDDAAKDFVTGWNNGLASVKTDTDLQNFFAEQYKNFDTEGYIQQRTADLQQHLNAANDELAKAKKDDDDVGIEAAKLKIEDLQKAIMEVEGEAKGMKQSMLDMLSPIQDLLSLTQALKGIESARKNLDDISKALQDQSLSLDQITELASAYPELLIDAKDGATDFMKALSSGDTALANAILMSSNDAEAMVQRYKDTVELARKSFKTQREDLEDELETNKKLSDVDKEIMQNQINSLKAQEAAANIAAEQELRISQGKAELFLLEEKEKLGEHLLKLQGREIEGAKLLKEVSAARYKDAQENLNKYVEMERDKYGNSFEEAYGRKRAGDENWLYDAQGNLLIAEEDMEEFTQYIKQMDSLYATLDDAIADNISKTKELTDANADLVNQLADLANEGLQKELDDLTENLDKREKAYEKYFDAVKDMEEESDYEGDRDSLINRIAQLSTATDATSLGQLKEAQEELDDLNKEYNEAQSDARQEAMMDRLDAQREAIEQAYEEEMEQTAKNIEAELGKDGAIAKRLDSLLLAIGDGEGTADQKAFSTVELLAKLISSGSMSAENATSEAATAAKTTIMKLTGMDAEQFKNIYKYKKGGLVDYTGPAWVDGTKSNPEAFLNAVDTQNIRQLTEVLRSSTDSASGITIEGMNINVTGNLNSPNETYNTGRDLASAFVDGLKRRGLNVNIKN